MRTRDTLDEVIEKVMAAEMQELEAAQAALKQCKEAEAKLRQELEAAVEHHSRYTSRIDRALGEPRQANADLCENHVREIERLRKQDEQVRKVWETGAKGFLTSFSDSAVSLTAQGTLVEFKTLEESQAFYSALVGLLKSETDRRHPFPEGG